MRAVDRDRRAVGCLRIAAVKIGLGTAGLLDLELPKWCCCSVVVVLFRPAASTRDARQLASVTWVAPGSGCPRPPQVTAQARFPAANHLRPLTPPLLPLTTRLTSVTTSPPRTPAYCCWPRPTGAATISSRRAQQWPERATASLPLAAQWGTPAVALRSAMLSCCAARIQTRVQTPGASLVTCIASHRIVSPPEPAPAVGHPWPHTAHLHDAACSGRCVRALSDPSQQSPRSPTAVRHAAGQPARSPSLPACLPALQPCSRACPAAKQQSRLDKARRHIGRADCQPRRHHSPGLSRANYPATRQDMAV